MVPAVLATSQPNRTAMCAYHLLKWSRTTLHALSRFLCVLLCRLFAGLVLQALLWALFGVQPLQGLQSSAVPSASVAALLVCAASQCAYNAASFRVSDAAAGSLRDLTRHSAQPV